MVTLRRAVSLDADRCTEIHLSARAGWPFLTREPHTGDETLAWMRETVLSQQSVWIAEVDRHVAGYIALDAAWITGLYVAPDWQGQGVGTGLLERAMAQYPSGLSLWVFEENRDAIRFYERHGFATAKKTNGESNEERRPERLMTWMPTGPEKSTPA